MKLQIKKFIYLVNDLTNILLKRSREEAEQKVKKLRYDLIIVSILLALSLLLNTYLIYSK
ncbi:MAG: hypothetical protein US81_C0019G0002 [Parcubacteria group bacterium GW2011_GWE2_38_18]|nr:MAG: hypothetical protein US81_C0019G0002 [Parcubacteria group bacterium GW2011_GWE2_38_18]